MDDILEILNMPSWSDIGGLRNQLEFNPPGAAELGALNSAEANASAGLTLDSGKQAATAVGSDFPDGRAGDQFIEFRQEESFLSSQAQNQNQNQQLLLENSGQQQQQLHDGISTLGVNSNMMATNQGNSSMLIHPPDTSSIMSSALGFDSRMWRQPYIGDLQQQLLKPDMFLNSSNPLFSTRYRSGVIPPNLRLHRDGARGVFNAYGLGQQKPPLQANSRGSYRNSQPAPVGLSGAPRPRVRARRGQATDPHSIAERQRRERIADRMKELQGLVPNANKTDKAIMLDEIIEYVKFLQLQSKIFTMCRMGSSGSVPCNIPPSEYSSAMASSLGESSGATAENLASLERQVARLMDESIGSALQLIQSKGFCLMPVSMAAALSATKAIHQPIFSATDKTETSTAVTCENLTETNQLKN